MAGFQKLIDFYTPPEEGYVLESFLATTYQVDFEFFEDDLLALALGVRTPANRGRAFRADIERRLQTATVSVLYDLRGCPKLRRASPRIDALPVITRKQHAKVSLLAWVRRGEGTREPVRRVRLIVGSANLTRQGFRENYECASALDFGGAKSRGRGPLLRAIDLVASMGRECESAQLDSQLEEFRAFAQGVGTDPLPLDAPVTFVTAEDALQELSHAWEELDGSNPELATVVSPFWPEGSTAGAALAELISHLANPKRVDLVCRGVEAPNGRDWIPEFDPAVAAELKGKISSRLFLIPALPSAGVDEDANDQGDESEVDEIGRYRPSGPADKGLPRRALHAKMIWLDGKKGSVGYTGSSNCTRRGLALGAASNWEAGLIYRVSRSARARMDLLGIAGKGFEVMAGKLPSSKKPQKEEESPVPNFLADIVARHHEVTIRFQKDFAAPENFEILMPVPTPLGDSGYWLVYQRRDSKVPTRISVDLRECTRCDTNLNPFHAGGEGAASEAAVYVEVRWEGNIGFFPVRFDDKASLPMLPAGRRPTENELIEYFLFGREPDWDGDGGGGGPQGDPYPPQSEQAVDTRRILSYFIRRFVQALPGIETEMIAAAYSRAALLNALKGPTSPLALAKQAFASLRQPRGRHEPLKTATAVGFQLVEICAALKRSKAQVSDKELRQYFDPVLEECRGFLNEVVKEVPALNCGAFQEYRRRILGEARASLA
jgi:hypothetical protein